MLSCRGNESYRIFFSDLADRMTVREQWPFFYDEQHGLLCLQLTSVRGHESDLSFKTSC